MSKIQEFAHSLTKKEKTYLWDHVFRYAGVQGTTAEEYQSCNLSTQLCWGSGLRPSRRAKLSSKVQPFWRAKV